MLDWRGICEKVAANICFSTIPSLSKSIVTFCRSEVADGLTDPIVAHVVFLMLMF